MEDHNPEGPPLFGWLGARFLDPEGRNALQRYGAVPTPATRRGGCGCPGSAGRVW